MRKLPDLLGHNFDDYFSKKTTFFDPVRFFIETATACIGITETGGDNKGPLVEAFQSVVGTPHAQSWCVDFIQGCIAYTEKRLAVSSPLVATEGVLDLWNRSKLYSSISVPKPGDLILWQHADGVTGHCGIITGIDNIAMTYSTIEGNTSDASYIDRNGDGVYDKVRPKGGLHSMTELGFLRVFGN